MFTLTTEQRAALTPVSEKLAPRAVELRTAGEAVDTAATPFSRSLFAALLTGVSLPMTETIVVAAYGSPKSPATGKPVKGVSGLRAVHGGAAAYQTFKAVTVIAAAMADPTVYLGADAATYLPEGVETVTVADIIAPMVERFALADKEAHKSLNALGLAVKAVLTAHAKAVTEAADAPPASGDNDNSDSEAEALPLSERLGLIMAEIAALSDEAFTDEQTGLAALSDLIVTRWEAIEAALSAPAEQEQKKAA